MNRIVLASLLLLIHGTVFSGQVQDCSLSVHRVNSDGSVNEKPSITMVHVANLESKGVDKLTGFNLWLVSLTNEGAEINYRLTSQSIGKPIAILCNGTLVSKPQVMEPSKEKFMFTSKGEWP